MTGYEYDIFISYAGIDNHPVGDEDQGWVDMLHERLETRLAQLLGEEPRICRNHELHGHDLVVEEDYRDLSNSATLVCILSPRYIKSESCLSELRAFHDRASRRAGLTVDGKYRIFKVVKTPIPYSSHPSEVQEILGYEFYEVDPAGRTREFDAQIGSNKDIRYWSRFDDLAYDLKEMLDSIRQLQPHQDQGLTLPANVFEIATQTEPPRPLRVFLCHSSGDKPAVRELYRRLLSDGVDPWLDEEKLLAGQKWEREISKAVRNCDVVLACLSQSSVNKRGYVQKEIKFALDVADEQPEDAIFLIPLLLEECDVPERLTSYQWVNIYEEKGYDKLMRSLRVCSSTLSVTNGVASK